MDFLFTAFAIGALGSFHCIGMCGPIALALPLQRNTNARRLLGSLLYNSGRIATYALMGALFGLLGQGFVMAGFQQTISVALGILVILGVALPAAFVHKLSPNHLISKGIAKVKMRMQKLFAIRSYPSLFFIGSLNGLLPCGMVYLGIAGATAMGNPAQGAAYMLLFGLGTWPVMVLVTFFGQWINIGIRNKIRAALPVMVVLMGVVFILRGLSLDIPFVSPDISDKQHAGIEICH
ncbi:sulfite exporter TauE/SafE family protein [Catalinimonas niigatensis]|uniref:sulfite exporter TauE/SafE family protein n=1 Tax=Catalinimonas niigatensis TaxID=1397264 RepID=UPI0026656E29|nr:sulfite exporter TauE/SafE family protein [Catalinimonas niigatensis]WPP52091.1 sulfite exporter TauE/SafE family protein [Catalinimonas niigatensis]